MKVGEITEALNTFSYKEKRFSEQKYILCVRDERYEYNAKPIIYLEHNKLIDLDYYEFENNLFASKPPYNNPYNIEDLPLNRFHINQLIKIDYGTIVDNTYAENPNLPKVKTFNANINPFKTNQIIEIFNGSIKESESLFTPHSTPIFDLIKNVYVESENCFFITSDNKMIGPFVAQKVNDDSFTITKSDYKKFGEYTIGNNTYLEFEANDIIRKVYIDNCIDLNLSYKKEIDFTNDQDLLKNFEKDLINYPEYFNEDNLKIALDILKKASQIDKVEDKIKQNNRLNILLTKSEKILNRDIDLLNNIPEIKELKENRKKIRRGTIYSNKRYRTIKSIKNRFPIRNKTIRIHKNC